MRIKKIDWNNPIERANKCREICPPCAVGGTSCPPCSKSCYDEKGNLKPSEVVSKSSEVISISEPNKESKTNIESKTKRVFFILAGIAVIGIAYVMLKDK